MSLGKLIIVTGIYLFTSVCTAKSVTIFDVRKSLPMKNTEKTYVDYYLNGGSEVGLKAGMIITVTRSQALYDAYQNNSPGNLKVPVGQLKIIHTQKGISVARVASIYSRSNLPVLDINYILVGDQADLSTAKMSKSASFNVVPKPLPVEHIKLQVQPVKGSATFSSKIPIHSTL